MAGIYSQVRRGLRKPLVRKSQVTTHRRKLRPGAIRRLLTRSISFGASSIASSRERCSKVSEPIRAIEGATRSELAILICIINDTRSRTPGRFACGAYFCFRDVCSMRTPCQRIAFHDHDDGVSEITTEWSNAHSVDPRENVTVTEG